MDEYKEILHEFDNNYEEFKQCVEQKDYAEAGQIQGYLLGVISVLQMLCDPEMDIELASEIMKRAKLIG